MAQTTYPQDNPNNILGCHPVISRSEQDQSDIEDPDEPAFPASRLSSASLWDGLTLWQRRPTRRRQALDRVLAKVDQAQMPGAEHVKEYLRQMYRRNCKARTICSTATSLIFFLRVVKSLDKAHLELITRRDIEDFVEREQDRGIKITTVRFRLSGVYSFLRYLSAIKMVTPDLLERKIRLKLPRHLPRAMPAEDSARLLAALEDTRDKAMVLMLLRTGMRIGELCNLLVNDVDLVERTVKIYEGEKNNIGRVVYISADACKALSEWMRQRNHKKSYLFYGLKGPLGYSICRERFKRVLQKAGLADKGYTLHCLRHTFATDLLNAGMRLEYLQQLLGHSNIEVTRIYAKLSDASRQKEYFRAMTMIEQGDNDESNGIDS